jgi:hypothetical protein
MNWTKRHCYFWSTLDEVFLLVKRGAGEQGRGHEKEQPVEEKKNFDNDNIMISPATTINTTNPDMGCL